jgi:hypothetical protein
MTKEGFEEANIKKIQNCINAEKKINEMIDIIADLL